MKSKFLLIIAFLLTTLSAYSRAGGAVGGGGRGGSWGGGGYGGGGRGFSGGGYHNYGGLHGIYSGENGPETVLFIITGILIFLIVFMFILYSFSNYKRTKKHINQSRKFDAFWNRDNMKQHVHEIFPKIQKAWTEMSFTEVYHLITPEFINASNLVFNNYKKRNLINVVQDISISKITIIDMHDDHNDTKDRFAALIKGEMRDFIMSKTDDPGKKSAEILIEPFEDLYMFRRKANRWLLDEIVNDPEQWQMQLS